MFELDEGLEIDEEFTNPFHVIQQIPYERLHEVEKDMAIIVPVKNERLRLLEGVLSGIPHACLPIVISNSEVGSDQPFWDGTKPFGKFLPFCQKALYHFSSTRPTVGRAIHRYDFTEHIRR